MTVLYCQDVSLLAFNNCPVVLIVIVVPKFNSGSNDNCAPFQSISTALINGFTPSVAASAKSPLLPFPYLPGNDLPFNTDVNCIPFNVQLALKYLFYLFHNYCIHVSTG